jgi:hypothetical protein
MKANISSRRLIAIAIAVLCLATSCATSGFTGYRTVEKPPRRVGSVSDSLIGYSPVEAKHFPSQASPYLEIGLKKRLTAKVRYDSRTHQEKIFKKQRSKIEANMLPIAGIVGMSLFFGEPYSAYALPAAGLLLLLIPPPPAEYSYTYVPGSDDVLVSYRDEVVSVPARGESLIAVGMDTVQTDENGVARFHVKPSQCDTGITIVHVTTGDSYLVRRVQKDSTVTADWVKTARILSQVVGSALTVRDLVSMVTAGAGTAAILLTVVVDAITGMIIDFVIEKLGTSTRQYYDWLIIVRQ